MPKYTPMMMQYLEIKEKYKDCILFFRLGDFYEMFFDDALTATRELNITLTEKGCGKDEDKAPMCGVPYHSAEPYISKLVNKGYKVAICEQTEDPKKTKTIVKRDVVRIVTPGTLLDTNVLDEEKNNFILCIYESKKGFGFSVCDVSTGEFLTTEFNAGEGGKIIDEIAKYNPTEIICNDEITISADISRIFDIRLTVYYDWAFDYQTANICLCNHFKTINLYGYGLEASKNAISSAGALLQYLIDTQKNSLSHISAIKKYSTESFMVLDLSSRKNLELTGTLKDNSKKGSLLWVLDKTKTPMGSRLLRKWIEQPLINIDDIQRRLDSVEKFKDDVLSREELKELLNTIYDIERLMGKIVYATANAKDLLALRNSLENLPYIKSMLPTFNSELINEIYESFDDLNNIYQLIFDSISEEAPFSVREGKMIRDGYNSEVDSLRNAKEDGANWLVELESKEKEATGIKNLKIRFNKVFGYYIEVTNSYLDLVPDRYIRKQTLSGSERYTVPELQEIEEKILGADEKAVELEYEIFTEIRNKIAEDVERVQKTANYIAEIDVFQSLGEVAYKQGYIKPVVNNSGIINITEGRHPVVELTNKTTFIPNNTYLDLDENRLGIITGPNMAGKSTYMRQTALLVLMAQVGSFIPADNAEIGIVDRIFTRVGASDDLATGQSTFMVEMSEVANILNNATSNSLLILDEIGRGTSTFDGLSIAWAVLEYIADKKLIGARTLFATHYHELTELEGKVEGVKNYCVSVKEEGEDIVFLRKIVPGSADHSYGVHVARLAGIPDSIIKRANDILEKLNECDLAQKGEEADEGDLYYTKPKSDNSAIIIKEICEELKKINVDKLSGSDAMKKLFEIKQKLAKL